MSVPASPVPAPTQSATATDLRRSLRDIVALTSLSAVWAGRQPAALSSSLANILRSGLDAEIVEVRITGESAPVLSRAVRPGGKGRTDSPDDGVSQNAAVNLDSMVESLFLAAQAPLGYDAEFGSVKVWSRSAEFPDELQRLFLNVAVNQAAMALRAHSLVTSEQTMRRQMERLFQLGQAISAELDRDRLLQRIIDAATELCGAEAGSMFYNVIDERGASCLLLALSDASRESLSDLATRRTTEFVPPFAGQGILRCGDVQRDPRYRKTASYGMPNGLPIASYLAVPVVSRSGETLGGLSLGHSEANVFTEQHEQIVASLASQAAIALDNQRLFEAATRSRRELEENNQQISNILESIKDGFFAVDRDWRFTFINDRGAQMVQGTRAELPGRVFWDVFSCEERLASSLRRAMLEREPAHLEEHDRARSAWLEIDAYPTRDGLAILVADVTQRKHFDERLRQTQKLESLGVLAGGIAHDFNNLLTGILGNASLVRDELPEGAAHRQMLDDVVEASERAAHLTSQLLAYAGKGRFVVRAMDLSTTVPSIAKLLRSSVPKNVQLSFELAAGLPPIVADTAQLQQLIMNLVVNAAEAIRVDRQGSVVVATRLEVRTEPRSCTHGLLGRGQYVCVEVRDDGVGMDEQTQARIFDPFFTTKFTGRGLGLAATLGIVLGHHGALDVQSWPGKGSIFQVFLPAADADSGEAAGQPDRASDLPALDHATVLVIDDEDVVRAAARTALERCACNVLSASGGREGIDLFRLHRQRVSLVLLDLTMPDMRGEEALRLLQAVDPDVKVLLSSGYSESETLSRFAGKRLAGFIQKPYTAAALARRVGEILCVE